MGLSGGEEKEEKSTKSSKTSAPFSYLGHCKSSAPKLQKFGSRMGLLDLDIDARVARRRQLIFEERRGAGALPPPSGRTAATAATVATAAVSGLGVDPPELRRQVSVASSVGSCDDRAAERASTSRSTSGRGDGTARDRVLRTTGGRLNAAASGVFDVGCSAACVPLAGEGRKSTKRDETLRAHRSDGSLAHDTLGRTRRLKLGKLPPDNGLAQGLLTGRGSLFTPHGRTRALSEVETILARDLRTNSISDREDRSFHLSKRILGCQFDSRTDYHCVTELTHPEHAVTFYEQESSDRCATVRHRKQRGVFTHYLDESLKRDIAPFNFNKTKKP